LGKRLEEYLLQEEDRANSQFLALDEGIRKSFHHNGWFTRDNVISVFQQLAENLKEEQLNTWIAPYRDKISDNIPHRIGIVMAGNIPLVGFHDFITTIFSGNIAVCKMASDDSILLPELAKILVEIEPRLEERIVFEVNQLKDIHGVLATGSNNTSRYFEHYFGKYPHVIRKNRNSVAVLNGNESREDLIKVARDIYTYFGLGCRSVSKLYVPEGYNFNSFFEATTDFSHVLENKKYANNYFYNRTVYLMGQAELLDNGFVILKEDKALASPVGVLFYEYYSDKNHLKVQLNEQSDHIQCVVAEDEIAFGQAQAPALWDYADKVDTFRFLIGLN